MSNFDSNPYSAPGQTSLPGRDLPGRDGTDVAKHSIFGIISFGLSILCGLGMVLAIVGATIAVSSNDDPQSPALVFLGLTILGMIGLNLLAMIFGVIGLVQRNTKKLLAIFGIVIAAGSTFLVVGLMIIGTVVG